MRRGDRAAAHTLFLQAARQAPGDPVALVFAGVTAPDDTQAETFLQQAQQVAPSHPAVRRGLKWLQARQKIDASQQPASQWVRRGLPAQPSLWLIGGGTLALGAGIVIVFLVLVLGTFTYLNVLRPAAASAPLPEPLVDLVQPAVAILPDDTPSAPPAVIPAASTTYPTPRSTATSTAAPTRTVKPSATSTRAASRTPPAIRTSSASPETAVLSPTQGASTGYPPASYTDFLARPGLYAGQPLRLAGVIVSFGEAYLDGRLVFALLLGPLPDEALPTDLAPSPVLVLGLAPDASFDVGVTMTVYGLGGSEMPTLIVQGIRWKGPVLLAEGVFAIQ